MNEKILKPDELGNYIINTIARLAEAFSVLSDEFKSRLYGHAGSKDLIPLEHRLGDFPKGSEAYVYSNISKDFRELLESSITRYLHESDKEANPFNLNAPLHDHLRKDVPASVYALLASTDSVVYKSGDYDNRTIGSGFEFYPKVFKALIDKLPNLIKQVDQINQLDKENTILALKMKSGPKLEERLCAFQAFLEYDKRIHSGIGTDKVIHRYILQLTVKGINVKTGERVNASEIISADTTAPELLEGIKLINLS